MVSDKYRVAANGVQLRCNIAQGIPFGELMRRIAALGLLLASSLAWSLPGRTENKSIGENGREARKAAKQQQKASKKMAKKQRKAAKKYQRAQRKAAQKQGHA